MPLQELTPPPPAPQRSDDADTFIERADAFVAWQSTFAAEIGVLTAQLETTAALIAAAPAYADPGLVAMTGKVPAADRLIYFTGAATSALAQITARARDWLAGADADDMLDALGLIAGVKAMLLAADTAAARAGITAARSGANDDITSIRQVATIDETGTVAANGLGFRGLPQNAKTAAYQIALSDAGKQIAITTGGVTIPANAAVAFPIGTTVVLFNNSGANQAVAITTDTLRFAGTTLTGARTLLPYGLATLVKVDAVTWVISGSIG